MGTSWISRKGGVDLEKGEGYDPLTNYERVQGYGHFAIKEHLLVCNHIPNFENFSFLTNSNSFKVTLTHFSPVMHLMWKPVICFAQQNKSVVSVGNWADMG